ncbi:MAG: sulfur globule protein precursor [Bradyrhizobiaceae bacterium]|nr:MAG: sulfur globule protein precursor [Bradyrhizobiaceae bacterium]
MLRKLSLAAVAAVALGAALAPTSASAHWHGGGPGWHGGYRWGGPRFYAPVSYGYGGCYVRRLVPTPWGPRWRLINRCY